jgi:Site-specific recombinase XerD
MDKRVKKYTKKDGATAYKFQIYTGINEQTGKQRMTTRRGFRTIKEATMELKRLEYLTTQGMIEQKNPNENITFNQVYKEWFSSYINTVRESTWYKRQRMFENRILPKLGKYRIRTIKTVQIQRAVNGWFKETTYNYKPWFNYTNAIFKYAIKQGYISDNPATRVIIPKNKEYEDKAPNFWTREQLKTFFSFIDPQKNLEKYILFRILAFSGIRRGECLALTWDDVNTQKNTLSINKTLAQGIKGKLQINNTKTKKGTRIIPLDNTTMKYLKLWHIQQRKEYLMLGVNTNSNEQLLFATNKNTFRSLNTPRKWLYAILNRDDCKLPKITIHGFRHTYASALFSAGATIKEAQELLGHEDAQTTLNIYTHVTQSQNKEASKKLVNYLDF